MLGRADVARNLGKNAGAYFGMPGQALEPVNFTKAGLDKFTKDVKFCALNIKRFFSEARKASAAKMKSASPVIGIDINQNMEELSKVVGVDVFESSIHNVSGKVDVIIDTTGIPEVIADAYEKLSNTGRLVLVGQPAPGRSIEIRNALSMFDGSGKSIRATQGGKTDPELKVIDPQIPKSLWYFTNASWLGFRIVRPLTVPSVEEMHKAWNQGPGPTE